MGENSAGEVEIGDRAAFLLSTTTTLIECSYIAFALLKYAILESDCFYCAIVLTQCKIIFIALIKATTLNV